MPRCDQEDAVEGKADLDKTGKLLQGNIVSTNHMKKNCTGCKEVDVTCNCTIEVLRENEFDIIILLDTDQGFKWCPESTVDRNFFKCSPGLKPVRS